MKLQVAIIEDFAPDFSDNIDGWIADVLEEKCLKKRYLQLKCPSGKKFGSHCIPIVLCESRQDLKESGVLCPYEFILERHHLVPRVGRQGELLTDPRKQLIARFESLAIKHPKGIDSASLRDWFAGLFRRYMFLDETVHGTSNLIDLDNLENDTIIKQACLEEIPQSEDAAQKLRRRFTGQGTISDSFFCYKNLLEDLFPKEMAEVRGALKRRSLQDLIKIYQRCADSYTGRKPYPRPLGDRAKYVTPTDKIDILLIDDNPQEIESRLDTRCKELFNIQGLRIDKREMDAFETAARAFECMRQKGLSFNLVLVDLCLGDEPGGDLTGYRMIKYVRKYFPGLPIVVYSRYRDMDHIARAFLCGARWFLVKGEESKLPRHVLRMLKQSGWHREWAAVKHSGEAPLFLSDDDQSEFMRRFRQTDEWQYLTYKGLEYLPGQFITVSKMGEGISSAVTFKAIKGVKLDGEYLQSPYIIKIDNAFNTAMEYERYYRMIRPYIANEAGRVEMPERVLNRDYASIVYTFAGRQNPAHALKSMGDAIREAVRYESSCNYERFRFAFDMIFDEILPQIHRVTPNREFGEGQEHDLHSGAVDSPESTTSAFPNRSFNEFSAKEFYKSYLSRMQPWKCIKIPEGALFVSQPQYNDDATRCLNETGYAGAECFTFHGVFGRGNACVLEAFDAEYHLVWLEGPLADHAARYRRLISPGKTLWLKGLKSVEGQDDRGKWFWESFELKDKSLRDFGNDVSWLLGGKAKQSLTNDEAIGQILALEDDLIEISRQVGKVLGNTNRILGCEFKAPIAIVHGDLNYGNVMLEARRTLPSPERPDERWTISDVWFIDFARTRRDVITHDFNVAFTATLAFFFETSLMADPKYKKLLGAKFAGLIEDAFSSDSKNLEDIPDGLRRLPRFAMLYRMLRRIRFAALTAGVSSHMYLLTSALACAYTIKIFLNKKKFELAAGLVVAMKVSYDLLLKDITDEEFKERLKSVSECNVT